MKSSYVEADASRAVAERPAHVSEALALRTYTARLLGREPSLVLHGGGNTSVKAQATTTLGEVVDVLHVKGSGWDLATIEPAGHPAVRLGPLGRLLDLATMTDEQMVNELRLALLDASAPTPSVETLLHAALPARFIEHTHADAILAVCDQAEGERICREIFGDELLWVPYVMPGFGLARACKVAWDAARARGRSPTVMVLERHGIFTFGDTARDSYERMIDAVTRAERHVERAAMGGRSTDRGRVESIPDEHLEARILPIVRGALAAVASDEAERAPIVSVRSSAQILAFLDRPDAHDLTQRGCATPDHVLRTKPAPLFVATPEYDDGGELAKGLERDIRAYASAYDRYFEDVCARKGVERKKLDPWPRVLLLPKVGIVAVGKTKKDAEIVADVYEHTIRVIVDACAVGSYAPLGRDDLFDVEYWSLEQAKLKPMPELPLARCVALVTGAASGIGKATTTLFVQLGAHVVACDRDGAALDELARGAGSAGRSQLVTCPGDVTCEADVEAAFRLAARTFGGVDVVVSNAGVPAEGALDTAEGEGALRRSLDMNLLSHVSVARVAAGVMRAQRRGGCLLFNASKSAFAPGPGFGPYAVAKTALVALMRQVAIDLAGIGVRANAVNADRVRTNLFAGGFVESRAAKRGLSVEEYFRSNLLGREVTAYDVAAAFAYLAQAKATTGCVLTVDGGNAAAFPR